MLPWQQRLYFWGVHGVFGEVVFTALWEWVAGGGDAWSLKGSSSVWSFLIYGLGTFLLVEPLHRLLLSGVVPLPARVLLYVMTAYVWEFCCGLVLDYWDACPWDYSLFEYNLYGLVTLEYAPFWALAGLYFEMIMQFLSRVEALPAWKKTLRNINSKLYNNQHIYYYE